MSTQVDPSFKEYEAGRREMAAGNYAGAIEHLRASVGHYPHFKTLELLGESMLEAGDSAGAIVPLAAAAGLSPREFRALYLLGKAFLELRDYQEALKHLDRALEMKPDFRRARELRAEIVAQVERLENEGKLRRE
jgi:tetratricopeptide (TPR) repeat protein